MAVSTSISGVAPSRHSDMAEVDLALGGRRRVVDHRPVGLAVGVVGVEQEAAHSEAQLLRDADLLVGDLPPERLRRHRVVRGGEHHLVQPALAETRVAVAARRARWRSPRWRPPAAAPIATRTVSQNAMILCLRRIGSRLTGGSREPHVPGCALPS